MACPRIEIPAMFTVLWVLIWGQLVFYMTPGVLQPNLYVEIQAMTGPEKQAADVFSRIMSLQCFLGFVTPILAQIWMDRREGKSGLFWSFPPSAQRNQGVRDVYIFGTAAAAAAALALAIGPRLPVFFGVAWAMLRMPPEALRSVRGKVIADLLRPTQQAQVGQLNTFAGLAGGALGPLISHIMNTAFHSAGDVGFIASALLASATLLGCCLAMFYYLPRQESTGPSSTQRGRWWPWICRADQVAAAGLQEQFLPVPAITWKKAAYNGKRAPDPQNVTNWTWKVSSGRWKVSFEGEPPRCDEDLELRIEQEITKALDREPGAKPLTKFTYYRDKDFKSGQWTYDVVLDNDYKGCQTNRETGTRRYLSRHDMPAVWELEAATHSKRQLLCFSADALETIMEAKSRGNPSISFEYRGWCYEITFPPNCALNPHCIGARQDPLCRTKSAISDGIKFESDDRPEASPTSITSPMLIASPTSITSPMVIATSTSITEASPTFHISGAVFQPEVTPTTARLHQMLLDRHASIEDVNHGIVDSNDLWKHFDFSDVSRSPQEITITQWFVKNAKYGSAIIRKRPEENYAAENFVGYAEGLVVLLSNNDDTIFNEVMYRDPNNRYFRGFIKTVHMNKCSLSRTRWIVSDYRERAWGHAFLRKRPVETVEGNFAGFLRNGTVLTSLGEDGEFALVRDNAKNVVGYIKSKYLLAQGNSMAAAVQCSSCTRLLHEMEKCCTRWGLGAAKPLCNVCKRCDCTNMLTERNESFGKGLCDNCYKSNFQDTGLSFSVYQRRCLIAFCAAGGLLEFGNYAAVVMVFQPLVVNVFGWTAANIAVANFASCILSFFVSGAFALKIVALQLHHQLMFGAILSLLSVLLITFPPVQPWRTVIAFVLGAKSQILFMSPFTPAYSQCLGKSRAGKERSSQLCFTILNMANSSGGIAGTLCSSYVVAMAGTPLTMLTAIPGAIVVVAIALFWRHLSGEWAKPDLDS